MLAPVRLELLFVLDQTLFRVVQLRFQEQVGLFGKVLAIAQIFLDVQRCEARRDLLGGLRIGAHVADPERVLAFEFDADVAAHLLDDVLHDPVDALLSVQVEVVDRALQARAAQDLVADGRKPILAPSPSPSTSRTCPAPAAG